MNNSLPINITQCKIGPADIQCNIMRLLYSAWLSGSLMMIVYVLYNICRFAFNCRFRDRLTLSIQILSLLSLIGKGFKSKLYSQVCRRKSSAGFEPIQDKGHFFLCCLSAIQSSRQCLFLFMVIISNYFIYLGSTSHF